MKFQEIDITGYKTLFLDRDGVINKLRQNDYVKSWDEFEFRPGILEQLSEWNKHFKHIIIVTNQRGVGKKIMTEKDLENIHKKMLEVIVNNKGRIDKIYYCTAVSDKDYNRKPNIGMFVRACREFPDIKPETSIMIGDSNSDMIFAENCGMKGLKISPYIADK